MAKEQDVVQLPFKITEFNEDMLVALSRNFTEIEDRLSTLQLAIKSAGGSSGSVVESITIIAENASNALADAANAQETADGQIQGFFQAIAPSTGMYFGDIWIDTDAHTSPTTADIYRYEDEQGGARGTLAWRATPTNAIGKIYLDAYNAQTTANSKIKTFYDDNEPTPTTVGDFWVDTNGNNRLYRWNGSSWDDAHDLTIDDKIDTPGYVKSEASGFSVYDASNNLRVLVGSWIRDLVRRYGIKAIEAEIYASTIRTGAEGATTYIGLENSNTLVFKHNGNNVLLMDSNGADGAIYFYNAGALKGGVYAVYESGGMNYFGLVAPSSGNLLLSGGKSIKMEASNGIWCYGDFQMGSGTKYNVEQTKSFGKRGLAVRESPEQWYIDEGIGLLVDGECRIDIDPIFLECIEPNTPNSRWHVKLTPYADVHLYVSEIGNNCFIVKECNGGTTIGAEFAWTLSATRQNFAGVRFIEK